VSAKQRRVWEKEQGGGGPLRKITLLGTPLCVTTYAELTALCGSWGNGGAVAVDFSNTQIVTMRRCDGGFRETTRCMDHFVPDGMPLIWALNDRGARMTDRVYGPAFMRECILRSPAERTHYLLGGSEECLTRLDGRFRRQRPDVRIVGSHHGYFEPDADEGIVEEINSLGPDLIWVGLGTPKQQEWIARNKSKIRRGALLAVGFAFDVNAGTKRDAPVWMQKAGLTWLHRLKEEPRRLGGRYLKWNSLFLYHLLCESLSGPCCDEES